MFDKMKQIYDMQKKARELQKQLEAMRVEKSTKDGSLKVSVNGSLRLEGLQVNPAWLSPDKKDTLERTLTGLINEALSDVQKQATSHAAGLMKGMEGLGL